MLVKNINNELFDHYVASHREYLNLLSNHRQEVRGYLLNKANNFIDLHVEKLKDIQSKVDSGNHLGELHVAHLQSVIDGYLHHKQMMTHRNEGIARFTNHMKRVAAGLAAIIGVSSMAPGVVNASELPGSLPNSGEGSQATVEVARVVQGQYSEAKNQLFFNAKKALKDCSGSLNQLREILDYIKALPHSTTLPSVVKKLINRLTGVHFNLQTLNPISDFLNETMPLASQSLEHAEKLVFAHKLIQQLLVSYETWSDYASDKTLQTIMIRTHLEALNKLFDFNQERITAELAKRPSDDIVVINNNKQMNNVVIQHQKAFADALEKLDIINDGLVNDAYEMVKSLLETENNSETKRDLLRKLSEVASKLSDSSSIKAGIKADINEVITSKFKLFEDDSAARSVSQELYMLEGRLNLLSMELSSPDRNKKLLDVAQHLRKLYEEKVSSEDVTLKMDIVRLHIKILNSLPSNISGIMPLVNWTIKHIKFIYEQLDGTPGVGLRVDLRFEFLGYYMKAIQLKPKSSSGPHTMKWAKEKASKLRKEILPGFGDLDADRTEAGSVTE